MFRQGAPILALYLVTTFIFATIFGVIYYHSKYNELNQRAIYELRDALDDVTVDFDNRRVDRQSVADGIKINVIDENSAVWLGEFERPSRRPERVIYGEERVYLTEFVCPWSFSPPPIKFSAETEVAEQMHQEQHERQGGSRFGDRVAPENCVNIMLESDDLTARRGKIIAHIIIGGLIVMALALGVAWMLLRLALRPLYRQISELEAFIKDTTHEINTPLSVILMSCEMHDINPKKYMGNIKTAAQTLSNIYNALVNLNLKPQENNLTSVNMPQLLSDRAQYFGTLAGKKGVQFVLDGRGTIETDIAKMTTIIDNLISNAVKYCIEHTDITIGVNEEKFVVSNLCKPLTQKEIDKIFDKFVRFESNEGGFGIGLYLVKKLCNELGYKISCSCDKDSISFEVKYA